MKNSNIAATVEDMNLCNPIADATIQNMCHDVNNFLQELLLLIEKMASIVENEEIEAGSKNNFNESIRNSIQVIFAIRDLMSGYAGIVTLPLSRHLELVSTIYNKNISLVGDATVLHPEIRHLLAVYVYLVSKSASGNLSIVVKDHEATFGPFKNPSHFLPSANTTAGSLIRLMSTCVQIEALEGQLVFRYIGAQ